MMNPYGVQRLYDLGLEEIERQHGRQAGRLHEVGAERQEFPDGRAGSRRRVLLEAGAEAERARFDLEHGGSLRACPSTFRRKRPKLRSSSWTRT